MIRRLSSSRHINQRNFTLAVGGALVAVIAAFFAYQLKFLRAPGLEMLDPSRDIIADADVFDVRGRTDDPEADLTLNGRPLYSGGAGEFTERIHLVKGVNALELEAKNRYGRATRITRYIVVR